MEKHEIIGRFTKSLIIEQERKNKVTRTGIVSTLTTAALNLAFVNESCKSSGQVSKSQVIYRKIDGKTEEDIHVCFQESAIKFLKLLKIFSRNRKFIISFDTTKEAFYGEFSKADDKIYLHGGSIAKESEFYYEYITAAITCNDTTRYILDGIIVPIGAYIEKYIKSMMEFIKAQLPIEVALFDRGFNSWELIDVLNKINVPYMIFWKKQGEWYKPLLHEMKDGEFKKILRDGKYYRLKYDYSVNSYFIIIKQLEYNGKKYDWIFATNLSLKSAESYVKRYKKRWGIETAYRVTDDIRIFTTSTNSLIRYFLFMFTCFVYNVWKFFQKFLGENFTLANFKVNMIIFLAKSGKIYPSHYGSFEKLALKTI